MICEPGCVRPSRGTKQEHYGICHKTFSSTSVGDKHRVPAAMKLSKNKAMMVRDGYRDRCLTEDEMRRIGMYEDDRGVWRGAQMDPRW